MEIYWEKPGESYKRETKKPKRTKLTKRIMKENVRKWWKEKETNWERARMMNGERIQTDKSNSQWLGRNEREGEGKKVRERWSERRQAVCGSHVAAKSHQSPPGGKSLSRPTMHGHHHPFPLTLPSGDILMAALRREWGERNEEKELRWNKSDETGRGPSRFYCTKHDEE